MKTSDKLYGLAIAIILAIAVLADSPNIELWTLIAIGGILGAAVLILKAINNERRGK